VYVTPNFQTKKALKEAVQRGEEVTVFAPGLGSPNLNGTETIEGPHYPQPHSWYARVRTQDGKVVKVLQ
jgi:hypothetical protein